MVVTIGTEETKTSIKYIVSFALLKGSCDMSGDVFIE